MAFVYWIHLREHSDITSQGYVGFTSATVEDRFKQHKWAVTSKRKSRIINAIKSHGDNLLVTTLLEGSVEYCQMIEFKLRPSEKIGWNIGIGGSATALGRKNSSEHIEKVRLKHLGRKHSKEHIEANRACRLAFAKAHADWNNPCSNKTAWSLAIEIHHRLISHPKEGRRTISKLFEIPPDSVLKLLNKVKSGWNPTTDLAYLKWLDDYKRGLNEQ